VFIIIIVFLISAVLIQIFPLTPTEISKDAYFYKNCNNFVYYSISFLHNNMLHSKLTPYFNSPKNASPVTLNKISINSF